MERPGQGGTGWLAEPVPPKTIAAVRAGAGGLIEQIIAAVGAENAVYREVLGAPEGIGIRLGIEQAIDSFLDAIERGDRPAGHTAEVWRRLGEAEFQAGRGLEALRAAFRTGTRAAWRGAAELAARAGMPAPVVIALAEGIFVYTEELAADVVEGYVRMQSDEASERQRRRRRLGALLVDDSEHDPETLAHAAELARWPLPRRLAVLALDGDDPGVLGRSLDVDALLGADGAGSWLIVPDPAGPGRAAALERGVRRADALAALGPAVAPREANRSLRWARLALELVRRGALPSEQPTRIDEHLAAAILHQDEELLGALTGRVLGPLASLPEPERERLLETLRSWLAHQRHAPRIAAELHVHPQTVRYRIGKLRELLGTAMDSPDGRFELELALRAWPAARG